MDDRNRINELMEKLNGSRTLLAARDMEVKQLLSKTDGLARENKELISQVDNLKQALKCMARFL